MSMDGPTINAIETTYSGIKFRSRLEARWAVFFDAVGVPWKYEFEGYEKGSVRYLPDFEIIIGGARLWVEVKGDPNWLRKNKERVIWMHSPEFILPDFEKSGLLILGDVPKAGNLGPLVFPVLQFSKVLNIQWYAFLKHDFRILSCGEMLGFHDAHKQSAPLKALSGDYLDFQPDVVPMKWAGPRVTKALDAARSARFEHGQSGALR